jgi:hypothetical protein
MAFWMKFFGFDKELIKRDIEITKLRAEQKELIKFKALHGKDIDTLQEGDVQDDKKDTEHDKKLKMLRLSVEALTEEIGVVAEWGNVGRKKLEGDIKERTEKLVSDTIAGLNDTIKESGERSTKEAIERSKKELEPLIRKVETSLTEGIIDVQKEFQEKMGTTHMNLVMHFDGELKELKESSHATHEDVKKNTTTTNNNKALIDNYMPRLDNLDKKAIALGKQIVEGDNNVMMEAQVLSNTLSDGIAQERKARLSLNDHIKVTYARIDTLRGGLDALGVQIKRNEDAIEQNVGLIDDIKGQL